MASSHSVDTIVENVVLAECWVAVFYGKGALPDKSSRTICIWADIHAHAVRKITRIKWINSWHGILKVQVLEYLAENYVNSIWWMTNVMAASRMGWCRVIRNVEWRAAWPVGFATHLTAQWRFDPFHSIVGWDMEEHGSLTILQLWKMPIYTSAMFSICEIAVYSCLNSSKLKAYGLHSSFDWPLEINCYYWPILFHCE